MSRSENTNCSYCLLIEYQKCLCCTCLSVSQQLPDQVPRIEMNSRACARDNFCRI